MLTRRAVLVMLGSHWLSMMGTGLVITAVISWLFLIATGGMDTQANPYLGILAYLLVPAIFFLGLICIPFGIYSGKKKVKEIASQARSAKRILVFLGLTTAVNVVVGLQLLYGAVEHMETRQFCGQTCHVMSPEFNASQVAGHSKLTCPSCHIAPGAAGWFEAKMAGTRQLWEVVMDSHPRPIPTASETNQLVPARETCEQCHNRTKHIGSRLRILQKYAGDEANTESFTVLMMLIGGGRGKGIHGAHLDPDIEIEFAPADARRQTIPWVKWRNKRTGETREYLFTEAKPDTVKSLPRFMMQCTDCHNRPAHTFDLPARAIDKAIAMGEIPSTLPFVKKTGLELLKANYPSQERAADAISKMLTAYYQKEHAAVAASRKGDIEQAGRMLAAIYRRNVFPDLKVTWGTYPVNLEHTEFPGCFRCHDGSHSTADGKTITQDCATCHEVLAVDESNPDVLKSLNLDQRLTNLKRP
jgi:nitrate/TMAO reductase-like tetraheme cytochrome c subunit